MTVAEVAAAAGVSEKTVFNYFPTKEDLFFDEVPEARGGARRGDSRPRAGRVDPSALRRLQVRECPRLCSPGFAVFARIIEESTALQAKELEVMARFVQVLTEAIRASSTSTSATRGSPPACWSASTGRSSAPRASRRSRASTGRPRSRRLRADLERAYELLEHGLGELEQPAARPKLAAGVTGRPSG